MPDNSSGEILRLLQDIENRSLQFAQGLPAQHEEQKLWEGVLCTVAGLRVIAPLEEVKEILNYPSSVTLVPGTKPWVLGIANIRGNLLPIFDLQVFLGAKSSRGIGRRNRVLVINHNGLFAGLLVGDVQGMRHFSEDQKAEVPILHTGLRPFVQDACLLEGEVVPVLSMNLLAENPDFQVAAA